MMFLWITHKTRPAQYEILTSDNRKLALRMPGSTRRKRKLYFIPIPLARALVHPATPDVLASTFAVLPKHINS